MAKKKTTRKPARPSRTATRRATPPVTDPHLTALLLFIHGGSNDDAFSSGTADEFRRAYAAARALLTSYPLTSAFSDIIDRPTLYEQIATNVLAEAPGWTDPDKHVPVIHAATYGDGCALGAHDTIEMERGNLQFVTCNFAEHGALVGACLMYELLRGGAR